MIVFSKPNPVQCYGCVSPTTSDWLINSLLLVDVPVLFVVLCYRWVNPLSPMRVGIRTGPYNVTVTTGGRFLTDKTERLMKYE